MLKKVTALFSILSISLSVLFAQAPKTYTSSELLLQLKKLNTVGSVLYIAAHPDDENTRLLAYLANEKCLRTGYLSLTRGDGGQNLIGSEQGIELGMIRTQELLAARRVDGAEQFFTRAYDFGFSKSPEETFDKWNKDSILADVVWVIRNFRPDIIITRFATDGSGGHGHHTASAILAEEAFDAAADPNRFPEQLKYVSVWKTRRLFHNSTLRFRDPKADMSAFIKLDVGGYNPLLGKSYGEIAAESRSMHKSQGFGSARQRGEVLEHFKPIKGDTTGLTDIFQGMDFTWKRDKNSSKFSSGIEKCISQYDLQQPNKSIPQLLEIYSKMDTSYAYHKKLLASIIYYAGGYYFEANTDKIYLAEKTPDNYFVTYIDRNPSSWPKPFVEKNLSKTQPSSKVSFGPTPLKTLSNVDFKDTFLLAGQVVSESYWLINGLNHNRFNISTYELNKPSVLTHPVSFLFVPQNKSLGDELNKKNRDELFYTFPIQYKWVDPEKGELYRPVVVTPPVIVNVQNEVITFSDDQPKEIKIILKAGKDNVNGMLKIKLPEGWYMEPKGSHFRSQMPAPKEAGAAFGIAKKGEEQMISFMVTPPATASEVSIQVIAELEGREYSKGMKEIKYDHIPVQTLFPGATSKLIRLDVTRKSKRIGYIPGAGDEVPACLSQLGYEVITITDDMLGKESLQSYDAIVTGVRAYNTNDKLSLYKQRLMDYVNKGGNLIVQYNTNSFAGPLKSDLGPYPFKITRDRVTNEEAAVTFELPDHPVLNIPNKITEKDFEGWIQERCIYSAGDLDSNYQTPLSMADPNEKANKGSLIIAKYGKGHFVYTGLVFFREMPAGVPGAYRLFVNLIELGK